MPLSIIIYNFCYTVCIYFLSHDTQPSLFACTVTKLSWRLEKRFRSDLCVGSGFPGCFGVLPYYHELPILQIFFWNPASFSGVSIDLSWTLFLPLGIYGLERFPPNNFSNYPKHRILLTERTLWSEDAPFQFVATQLKFPQFPSVCLSEFWPGSSLFIVS